MGKSSLNTFVTISMNADNWSDFNSLMFFFDNIKRSSLMISKNFEFKKVCYTLGSERK